MNRPIKKKKSGFAKEIPSVRSTESNNFKIYKNSSKFKHVPPVIVETARLPSLNDYKRETKPSRRHVTDNSSHKVKSGLEVTDPNYTVPADKVSSSRHRRSERRKQRTSHHKVSSYVLNEKQQSTQPLKEQLLKTIAQSKTEGNNQHEEPVKKTEDRANKGEKIGSKHQKEKTPPKEVSKSSNDKEIEKEQGKTQKKSKVKIKFSNGASVKNYICQMLKQSIIEKFRPPEKISSHSISVVYVRKSKKPHEKHDGKRERRHHKHHERKEIGDTIKNRIDEKDSLIKKDSLEYNKQKEERKIRRESRHKKEKTSIEQMNTDNITGLENQENIQNENVVKKIKKRRSLYSELLTKELDNLQDQPKGDEERYEYLNNVEKTLAKYNIEKKVEELPPEVVEKKESVASISSKSSEEKEQKKHKRHKTKIVKKEASHYTELNPSVIMEVTNIDHKIERIVKPKKKRNLYSVSVAISTKSLATVEAVCQVSTARLAKNKPSTKTHSHRKGMLNVARHRNCLVRKTLPIVDIVPQFGFNEPIERKKNTIPFKKYYCSFSSALHSTSDSNKLYINVSDYDEEDYKHFLKVIPAPPPKTKSKIPILRGKAAVTKDNKSVKSFGDHPPSSPEKYQTEKADSTRDSGRSTTPKKNFIKHNIVDPNRTRNVGSYLKKSSGAAKPNTSTSQAQSDIKDQKEAGDVAVEEAPPLPLESPKPVEVPKEKDENRFGYHRKSAQQSPRRQTKLHKNDNSSIQSTATSLDRKPEVNNEKQRPLKSDHVDKQKSQHAESASSPKSQGKHIDFVDIKDCCQPQTTTCFNTSIESSIQQSVTHDSLDIAETQAKNSSFLLTKSYRAPEKIVMYERRKKYSEQVRQKLLKQHTGDTLIPPGQVMQIRYLTISQSDSPLATNLKRNDFGENQSQDDPATSDKSYRSSNIVNKSPNVKVLPEYLPADCSFKKLIDNKIKQALALDIDKNRDLLIPIVVEANSDIVKQLKMWSILSKNREQQLPDRDETGYQEASGVLRNKADKSENVVSLAFDSLDDTPTKDILDIDELKKSGKTIKFDNLVKIKEYQSNKKHKSKRSKSNINDEIKETASKTSQRSRSHPVPLRTNQTKHVRNPATDNQIMEVKPRQNNEMVESSLKEIKDRQVKEFDNPTKNDKRLEEKEKKHKHKRHNHKSQDGTNNESISKQSELLEINASEKEDGRKKNDMAEKENNHNVSEKQSHNKQEHEEHKPRNDKIKANKILDKKQTKYPRRNVSSGSDQPNKENDGQEKLIKKDVEEICKKKKTRDQKSDKDSKIDTEEKQSKGSNVTKHGRRDESKYSIRNAVDNMNYNEGESGNENQSKSNDNKNSPEEKPSRMPPDHKAIRPIKKKQPKYLKQSMDVESQNNAICAEERQMKTEEKKPIETKYSKRIDEETGSKCNYSQIDVQEIKSRKGMDEVVEHIETIPSKHSRRSLSEDTHYSSLIIIDDKQSKIIESKGSRRCLSAESHPIKLNTEIHTHHSRRSVESEMTTLQERKEETYSKDSRSCVIVGSGAELAVETKTNKHVDKKHERKNSHAINFDETTDEKIQSKHSTRNRCHDSEKDVHENQSQKILSDEQKSTRKLANASSHNDKINGESKQIMNDIDKPTEHIERNESRKNINVDSSDGQEKQNEHDRRNRRSKDGSSSRRENSSLEVNQYKNSFDKTNKQPSKRPRKSSNDADIKINMPTKRSAKNADLLETGSENFNKKLKTKHNENIENLGKKTNNIKATRQRVQSSKSRPPVKINDCKKPLRNDDVNHNSEKQKDVNAKKTRTVNKECDIELEKQPELQQLETDCLVPRQTNKNSAPGSMEVDVMQDPVSLIESPICSSESVYEDSVMYSVVYKENLSPKESNLGSPTDSPKVNKSPSKIPVRQKSNNKSIKEMESRRKVEEWKKQQQLRVTHSRMCPGRPCDEFFGLHLAQSFDEIMRENSRFLSKDFSYYMPTPIKSCDTFSAKSRCTSAIWPDLTLEQTTEFLKHNYSSFNIPQDDDSVKDKISKEKMVDFSVPGSDESGYTSLKSNKDNFFKQPNIKALLRPTFGLRDFNFEDNQTEKMDQSMNLVITNSFSNCSFDISYHSSSTTINSSCTSETVSSSEICLQETTAMNYPNFDYTNQNGDFNETEILYGFTNNYSDSNIMQLLARKTKNIFMDDVLEDDDGLLKKGLLRISLIRSDMVINENMNTKFRSALKKTHWLNNYIRRALKIKKWKLKNSLSCLNVKKKRRKKNVRLPR